MKDYHTNHHQRRFWKNSANNLSNYKITACVILLILTYALGYFTASSSSSKQPPHHVHQKIVPPTKSTDVLTTADISCSPSTSSPILDKNNDHNQFGPVCSKPIRPDQVRSTIINGLYDGASPYVNFPSPHIAPLLQPKKVKGWGSYGAVFENLIKKTRPKTIIEIGSFLGASATHMAKLTQNLGLGTQILCIDDFRGWPGFRDSTEFVSIQNGDVLLLAQFMQNVMYLNHSEVIMPLPFSTGGGLQKLCEWGVYGDLIEVDAGHDFHSAWSDINMAHKLLAPGGVMFGHDYLTGADNKGVRRAVDLFAKVRGYKVYVDGQHWVLK